MIADLREIAAIALPHGLAVVQHQEDVRIPALPPGEEPGPAQPGQPPLPREACTIYTVRFYLATPDLKPHKLGKEDASALLDFALASIEKPASISVCSRVVP